MSYRNITVEGKTYQYIIGRSFVKIKGLGIFSGQEHGTKLKGDKFVITPKNVKNIILGLSRPTFYCKTHNVKTDELTVDPFSAEIYGKNRLMINCPHCVQQAADDI